MQIALLLFLLASGEPHEGYTLALSGGGARGIAHIGVIRALEDQGVSIRGVAGTSMGALVGGLYSSGFSGAEMDSIARSLDWDLLFSGERHIRLTFLPERHIRSYNLVTLSLEGLKPVLPPSAFSTQRISSLVTSLVAPTQHEVGANFDSLPVPLRVVAFDLKSRERVVHRRGDLTTALLSSMAIPTAFPAVRMGDSLLVDGGVVNNLPVGVARETWPYPVISVDISSERATIPDTPTLVQVGTLTLDALTSRINEQYSDEADYHIRPSLKEATLWSFDMADSLLAWGYSAGEDFLNEHPEIVRGDVSSEPYSRRSLKVRTLFFGGLERVHFTALAPWLVIDEGDDLTPEHMRQAVESLYASGLFRRVEARLLATDDPASVDLVFQLEEREPGSFGFDIAYHSEFGLDARIDIEHMNIFNLGRQIRFGLGGGERHVFSEFRLLNLMAQSIWYNRVSAAVWQAETPHPGHEGHIATCMETQFSGEATRGRTMEWDSLIELGVGIVSHRWGDSPGQTFGRLFARLNAETFDDPIDPHEGTRLLAEITLNDPFNNRHQIFTAEYDRASELSPHSRLFMSGWGQLCSGKTDPWQYARMTAARTIPGVPWQGLHSRQRIAALFRYRLDFDGPLFATVEVGVTWDWHGFYNPQDGAETTGSGFGLGILTPAGPAMLRVGRSSIPDTRWTLSLGSLRGFGPGR